ncbi:hypothetical protein V8C44DRAFT_62853 [Trichoderma aethiopicum]
MDHVRLACCMYGGGMFQPRRAIGRKASLAFRLVTSPATHSRTIQFNGMTCKGGKVAVSWHFFAFCIFAVPRSSCCCASGTGGRAVAVIGRCNRSAGGSGHKATNHIIGRHGGRETRPDATAEPQTVEFRAPTDGDMQPGGGMPSSSGLLGVRRGGDWLPGGGKGLAASKRAGCLVKCAAKQRVIHWRCYVLGRLMTAAMGHMHGIVVLICVGTE